MKTNTSVKITSALLVLIMIFIQVPLSASSYSEGGEAIVCVSDDYLSKLCSCSEETAEMFLNAECIMSLPDENRVILLLSSDVFGTDEIIRRAEMTKFTVYAEENTLYSCAGYDIPEKEYKDKSGSSYSSVDLTSLQWSYNGSGKYGADVPGWDKNSSISENGNEVVVAVIDSGINYDHPDLKNQMWEASSELISKIGGGKYGFNPSNKLIPNGREYTEEDPMDDYGHGSHCAGIIAGEWKNGGISGLSDSIKLMAVKVMDNSGLCLTDSIIKGLEYVAKAIENGVNVRAVNISIGLSKVDKAIFDALTKLSEYNAVICCASGNNSIDRSSDSSGFVRLGNIPGLLRINASDRYGKPADFTNYGKYETDIFAPGTEILSSTCRESSSVIIGYSSPATDSSGKEYFSDFDDGTYGFLVPDYEFFAQNGVTIGIEENIGTDGSSALHIHRNSTGEDGIFEIRFFADLTALEEEMEKSNDFSFGFNVKSADGGDCIVSAGFGDKSVRIGGRNEHIRSEMWIQRDRYCKFTDNENYEFAPFVIRFEDTTDCNDFFLDDFIISNDLKDYVFYDGTSMSAPVVTAEAAVLSSVFPDDCPEKTAARITASAKTADNTGDETLLDLKDMCKSGGIASLCNALDESTYVPVLRRCVSEGDRTLRLEGYFFGEKGEIPEVTVNGEKAENVSAVSGSFGEMQYVTVTLPQSITGPKAEFILTNSSDLSGRGAFATCISEGMFEDMPLPEDNGSEDNEMFYSSEVCCLCGIGNCIYCFVKPSETEYPEYIGLAMFCFDPLTKENNGWRRIAIPGTVTDVYFRPAVHKEKIYLSVYEEEHEYFELYSFDPKTDSFDLCPSDDRSFYEEHTGTLVSSGDELLFICAKVRNREKSDNPFFDVCDPDSSIFIIDTESGTHKIIGNAAQGRSEAIAGTDRNGDILLAYGTAYDENEIPYFPQNIEKIKVKDGKAESVIICEDLSSTIPDRKEIDALCGAVVPYGIKLTGPVKLDENGMFAGDTWDISLNGNVKLSEKTFDININRNYSACVSNGYYYVISNNSGIDNKVFLFKRTSIYGKWSACDCEGEREFCTSSGFSDMPKYENWAHEGIDFCTRNGLMNGKSENTFDPDGTLTRAQLVTILYRAEDMPETVYTGSFSDVPDGKWFTDAVEWAAANGIVNGISSEKFDPNGKITREQIAAILYRYAGAPEADETAFEFPDGDKVSVYAKEAMIWANSRGLIKGVKDGNTVLLQPKSNASRAQICAIIMRLLLLQFGI